MEFNLKKLLRINCYKNIFDAINAICQSQQQLSLFPASLMKRNEGLIVSLLKVCKEVEIEFVSVYEDGKFLEAKLASL